MVDEKQIARLLKKHFKISGTYSIDPHSGVVNVDGNVDLKTVIKVTQLPVTFGKVKGNFLCVNNNLTSLQGAPTSVGGFFRCFYNQLTSLQGAPTSVGTSFDCSFNEELKSLQGAPTSVGSFFQCNNMILDNLQGAPESVGGSFVCNNNRLESLQGAPKSVGKNFSCVGNQLKSLQGAPDHVGFRFSCTYNKQMPLLKLLAYNPVEIYKAPDAVTEIMTRYQGQGRNSSLACGAELARAGFKENARW